jgi:hypothetical protein
MNGSKTCDSGNCNKCDDWIHRLCGEKMKEYNAVGDNLLIAQMVLGAILLACGYIPMRLAGRLLVLTIVFFVFRQLMAEITLCEADVNMKNRPLTSSDPRWFILSGHTFCTLILAYAIAVSSVDPWVKVVGILTSVVVMFFQTATREHYTVDILLTAFVVYIALTAFIRPCSCGKERGL